MPNSLEREAWQERMLKERDDLEERLEKLRKFFLSASFSDLGTEERKLLLRQERPMHDYLRVLNERIALFAERMK